MKSSVLNLFWLAGIIFAILGCSPKAANMDRKPLPEEIHGIWRSGTSVGSEELAAEVSIFQGGFSSVANFPVYLPSSGRIEVVTSDGQWEIFPRENLEGEVRWTIMLQVNSLKLRVPFNVKKEQGLIVLEYRIDPELANRMMFKRVIRNGS